MALGIFLCCLSMSLHLLLEGFDLFGENEECELDCVKVFSILLVVVGCDEVVTMSCEVICDLFILWCSFL